MEHSYDRSESLLPQSDLVSMEKMDQLTVFLTFKRIQYILQYGDASDLNSTKEKLKEELVHLFSSRNEWRSEDDRLQDEINFNVMSVLAGELNSIIWMLEGASSDNQIIKGIHEIQQVFEDYDHDCLRLCFSFLA